jgi:hypothetical protein
VEGTVEAVVGMLPLGVWTLVTACYINKWKIYPVRYSAERKNYLILKWWIYVTHIHWLMNYPI